MIWSAIWLAIKAFIGGVVKQVIVLFGWCVEHWKVVVPTLALLINFWFMHHFYSQRNAIQAKYDTHIAADKAAADQRKSENEAKATKAQTELAAINTAHDKQIAKIRSGYDAKTKDTANLTDAQWRDRLRDAVKARVAAGLPSVPSATEGAACQSPDSDGTVIRTGCAITTQDYNSLWDAWHNSCKIYGCK